MFLSLTQIDKKYYFTWDNGKGLRHKGFIKRNPKLIQLLNNWQQEYRRICDLHPTRMQVAIRKSTDPKNSRQKLNNLFSDLVRHLNLWLRSSEDFWQAERKARQQTSSSLTLIIDPNSYLALLPWEYCFLGQDYL